MSRTLLLFGFMALLGVSGLRQTVQAQTYTLTDLGPANALMQPTDKGLVVGCRGSTDTAVKVWEPGKQERFLGTTGNFNYQPDTLNAGGQGVGRGVTQDGKGHAFFWDPGK